MSLQKITIDEAKQFLIKHQKLDQRLTGNKSHNIMSLFKTLGCIQYDPLNVVGRNPDLVLQSRIQNYKKKDLENLLYEDRQLIDAWDKMMAIYPIKDWPYFHYIRSSHGKGTINTLNYRNSSDALLQLKEVKTYIRENGPLQSSKLKSASTSNDSWGHRKLSSAALDYLFSVGELGIHSKSNTQKIYDLIENILPEDILETQDAFTNIDDFIDWYILRRINTMGLIWNKSGGAWLGYYIYKKAIRTKSLKRLEAKQLIKKINIESISEDFYISKLNLECLENSIENFHQRKKPVKQVRFLAPLDNFIWDRDLIESLFNFNYRWEVYTPLAKRQYGYYVLPILYGYDIIGRIEFDYYRGQDELRILNRWFEPSFKQSKLFDAAFNKELKLFTNYLKN